MAYKFTNPGNMAIQMMIPRADAKTHPVKMAAKIDIPDGPLLVVGGDAPVPVNGGIIQLWHSFLTCAADSINSGWWSC